MRLESLEVMYPYQRLLEEGYDVKIAAPTKKKLHFVVHDFEPGFDTYTEKLGYSWDADLAFADVNPADYAALVIPGGRAPEYIRNNADCLRIVRAFFEEEASGPDLPRVSGAARGRSIEGRRTAAYPALQPDIQAGGAEFVDSEAVIDGAMVSARAWPDHPAWMRAFISLLKQKAPLQKEGMAAR